MQLSAAGKVLEEKIETCTCDLSINFVFSNLSTHPEKYFRTSV
jgi:hypothetical protein